MTVTVKHKVTSPRPGKYTLPVTVDWDFGPDVRKVAFSMNDLAPAISEYIAYDTLVPPNPFIAVTQDGSGNVCFDGGFPKFYNGSQAAGVTLFSQLTPSFKYLHNALMFIANDEKFAEGKRKILILGDANTGENYNIMDYTTSNFRASLNTMTGIHLNGVVGDHWEFVYKTRSSYSGGLLNPTLDELEEYVGCVIFSTLFHNTAFITDAAVNDLVTYRKYGSGLLFITDHGAVVPDLQTAKNSTPASSFNTANKVMVNFGAWFSGDYNRSPVNVGFIRATYGDHPLYNGMADSEYISAGGSESKVIVNESVNLINPEDFQSTYVSETGINNLNFLLLGNNGEIKSVRYVYIIGEVDLLHFKDALDVPITGNVDVGFQNALSLDLEFNGYLIEGTVRGSIYKNDEAIGGFSSDRVNGSVVDWYAGAATPIFVNNQDIIRAAIEIPFTMDEVLTITRLQPEIENHTALANVVNKLKPITPFAVNSKVVSGVMDRINSELTAMEVTKRNSENVKLIKAFMRGDYLLPETQAYVFGTTAEVNTALSTLVPPTAKQIFDTWDRISNDEYFPKGVGATGEAAAWVWDEALQSARIPVNSATFLGFVSDEYVDYYNHEVTLRSTDADNDGNGVILAFHREGGINHQLVALISPGYDIPGSANINIIYRAGAVGGSLGTIIQSNHYDDIYENWSNQFKRVSVQRRGNTFSLKFSKWNTTNYDSNMNMVVNLDEHPDLQRFKGPKQYGYYNQSQANSFFQNITYYGGFLRDIIVDVQSNAVYKYRPIAGWELLAGVKPHNVFGSPRVLRSTTDQRFRLNRDKTITAL